MGSACEPDLDFLKIAREGRGADPLYAKAAESRQSSAFQPNSRLFALLFPRGTCPEKSSSLSKRSLRAGMLKTDF